MLQNQLYERFAQRSPVTAMTRLLLESALSAEKLDRLFGEVAKEQYSRELLFSTLVSLMTEVVFRIRPTIHAAYREAENTIPVSIQSVYNKLNGIEPTTATELIRHTHRELRAVIQAMNGEMEDWLPGYQVKILDGNRLGATEHRIAELREIAAGPLPGLSIAVLDCSTMMVQDLIQCEDGHAQERALLPAVLRTVKKNDLWIGDRNFCTASFLHGIAAREGFFLIRQHATNAPWEPAGKRRRIGRIDTGMVYEQPIRILQENGDPLMARRVTVELDKPTRDRDTELHLLTNLPPEDADAQQGAEMYRGRWSIETAFQQLTTQLRCEVNTLGYPRAALFGFCIAVTAFNLLSAIKASIRAEHGQSALDNISSYYLTEEITATYRGMMVMVEPVDWEPIQEAGPIELGQELRRLAGHIRLARFRKTTRGPKKPVKPRVRYKKEPHVSTAKVLAKRKKARSSR